jgi:hypothetical protein
MKEVDDQGTKDPETMERRRQEAIARLDEIRRQIGRLSGFSTLEILRRDRDRDGE